MRKLVFYSDFRPGMSDAVDARLLDLLDGTSFSIGYIPSDSDKKRRYFKKLQENYEDIGITDVMYFDLNEEFDETLIPRLLSCAAIHLSGGDALRFLTLLQRRQFFPLLKKFVENGGVLVGVSAGAMLMTPTLNLCSFFDECKGQANRKSLELVDFEFYPHFDGDEKTLKKLCEYSAQANKLIYACSDAEGLVVIDEGIEFIGEVTKICAGQIQALR